jgi:hypothetical protein
MPTHEQVGETIRIFKSAVDDVGKERRREFLVTILNIILILALVTLSIIFSNLAGTLTSLGLGGTSAASKASNWSDAAKGYLKDKGKLARTVNKLDHEYALCGPTDTARLEKLADTIKKCYKILDALS